MPGRGRTGPIGQGPLTGWGHGNCATSSASRGPHDEVGGRRGGVGRRGSWRHRFRASGRSGRLRIGRWYDPVPPWSAGAQQLELPRKVAELESELERIRTRLDEIQGPVSE